MSAAQPAHKRILLKLSGEALAGDAEVGIDFSRVVHGDQRFLHVRPIRTQIFLLHYAIA